MLCHLPFRSLSGLMYAEVIGIPASTLTDYRWVSSRWAKDQRLAGVSHYVAGTAQAPAGDGLRIVCPRQKPRSANYRRC